MENKMSKKSFSFTSVSVGKNKKAQSSLSSTSCQGKHTKSTSSSHSSKPSYSSSSAKDDAAVIRAKRAKYSTVNAKECKKVFRDLKNTASRHTSSCISSVKTTFDNLSQRLKMSSPKGKQAKPKGKGSSKDLASYYNQLEDDENDDYLKTPLKLYSPFGIETPSPSTIKRNMAHQRQCRKQMFVSPTGKIKEDVSYLTDGISELNMMSQGIRRKLSGASLMD